MNFLKKFWIVVSLTMALPSHAEWTFVASMSKPKIAKFYVDDRTIKRNAKYTYYWLLTDYAEQQEGQPPYRSAKTYYEADCNVPMKMRGIVYHLYTGQRGDGTSDTAKPNAPDWEFPAPDTVGEAHLEFACNFE